MLKNALVFVKSWKNCRSVIAEEKLPLTPGPHPTCYSRSIYVLLLSTAQISRHR